MTAVAIIGGGIAGLATAYELHRRGIDFTVLDAGSRAGGVILSEEIDGYVIDGGPDALLIQKPDGVRLCEELGLGPRLVPTNPPRFAFIQRAGRLHPLPASSVLGVPTQIGPFARTALFSWAGKLRMAAEWRLKPETRPDESIAAFMRRHFGSEAVDYLAEPLLAGIHAGDVERLSVQSLFPRFVEAERTDGSLIRAFRRHPRPASSQGAFRSLPGGLSELVRALVKALPAESVRLNTPVQRVTKTAAGYLVDCGLSPAMSARAVVLAAPAYVTAGILREADAKIAGLCADVPYASTATIAMAFPRDAIRHPLQGSGFVVPKVEASGILAASWLSSKWPHRAPDGRVLLRTFVGGARDPDALAQSDQALIERSLGALRPLLGMTGAPLLTRVYRWTRASAQHEVGHLERIRAVDQALTRHPGLYITGSGLRGVGIPDCVADGRATARRVAEWLAT